MVERNDLLIEIIEDNIYSVTSLSNYLENEGFRTIWAYNGKEGIELCKKKNPDLVIIDVKMKEMSGFEVAKQISDKKVIFMTGEESLMEKAKKYKQSLGVVKKPVDHEEIIEIIKKKLKIE